MQAQAMHAVRRGWWWRWRLRCCCAPAMPRRSGPRATALRPMARTRPRSPSATRPSRSAGRRSGAVLAATLAKVTGDRQAGSRPGVRDELAKARTIRRRLDYRQDEGVSATGAPSFQTTLVVRFKQEAVDDLIDMLGIPVWPSPRPKPVLWLAIDDGSGPRLVGALGSQRSPRHPRPGQGTRFALGLRAAMPPSRPPWGRSGAAIPPRSPLPPAANSPPMQLIAALSRGGAGWSPTGLRRPRQGPVAWSTSNPDARRAMAGGADGAADACSSAMPGQQQGAPGTFRVRILGLRSSDDYLRLMGYLDGLSIVKGVRPAMAARTRWSWTSTCDRPGRVRADRRTWWPAVTGRGCDADGDAGTAATPAPTSTFRLDGAEE